MATISTKFNVGDKVFTIDKESMKIIEFEVRMISASCFSDGTTTIRYTPKDCVLSYDEFKCFATKHELLTFIEQPVQE